MSVCKKCGAEIVWIKTTKGWIPHNADDGAMHWEFCKKKLSPDTVMERSAGWIVGEEYYDCKCDCGVPPWEVCEHSFKWALDAEYEAMAEVAAQM